MDTYTLLREFADSWGLLLLVAMFPTAMPARMMTTPATTSASCVKLRSCASR